MRRSLPKGILRQTNHNSMDINYNDKNYWDQTFEPEYERDQGPFEQENLNISDEPGGYPSTLAPLG